MSSLDCALATLLDAKEVHPAVRLLLDDAGFQEAVPLGGLGLEEKAKAFAELLKMSEVPQVSELVPGWFADELFVPAEIGRGEYLVSVTDWLQSRPPTWLRTSDQLVAEVKQVFEKNQLDVRASDKLPCALALNVNFDVSILPAHLRDSVQVQDLASQVIGLLCAPKKGENWWDMCAGSGGKTIHLADLMSDTGEIFATDIRKTALYELKRRAKQTRHRSIVPELITEGEDPAPDKTFDGILVDAPCSGSGTWHRNPDARWRIEEGMIPEFTETQLSLLDMGAAKLRKNGLMIYSVCSVLMDETEGIKQKFLEKHPEFEAIDLLHPLTGEMVSSVWVEPSQADCNGMFAFGVRRKNASLS
ncbi:MAG: RsmB/NOP family class I SAM-dependent RNA methyltransferase [Lentisphaerae bacterium]|nr:RsmB/NOP family class I SAM-dependent RNA methyltransferase [Lentisphaerota bacterium]